MCIAYHKSLEILRKAYPFGILGLCYLKVLDFVEHELSNFGLT